MMAQIYNRDCYVYRHVRLDKNEPFYIGIGAKSKHYNSVNSEYSRAYNRICRNEHWKNIVSKTEYEVEILIDNVFWSEACEKEKEFIKLYGRSDKGVGPLANWTDGGDGGYGVIASKETREKKSIISKIRGISKETREKMAEKLRGRPQPEWQRKILSEAAKGKYMPWAFRPILQYSMDGIFINEFVKITDAAKELNLHRSNIIKALKGKRNHTGGFIFKYKYDKRGLNQ